MVDIIRTSTDLFVYRTGRSTPNKRVEYLTSSVLKPSLGREGSHFSNTRVSNLVVNERKREEGRI